MAHIPDNLLDQILDRCDIAEVISGYIPLKRMGRNYKALCPFHQEKTPSFVVNPDKGIFHCFGCGAGGNAFSFIMKYERMEFPEAARMLAKRAGVVLPERNADEDGKSGFLLSAIYRAHELAAAYFHAELASPRGRGAREYLAKRGVNIATTGKFRIGFAADSWDGLLGHLKKNGISEEIAEKSGLGVPRSGGSGCYDRFRNRIIFPIFDQKDKVIAFGGRVMDDTLPKYMNSPETLIYSKSRTLFGLNFTKNSIGEKDAAVIVEGYMDLIVPYQSGVTNLAALCGTALTAEHIRFIRRYTRNVIIVYDSDKAGEAAALRSLDILLAEDMDVKIAELPKGYDPDSFVGKNGAAAFEKIIADSSGIFDYKLSRLLASCRADKVESKARIAGEMLETIAKVKNDILRSAYIRKLAESLNLDENSLRTELSKPKKEYNGFYENARIGAPAGAAEAAGTASIADKTVIGIMIEDNSLIPFVKARVSHVEFGSGIARSVAESIFKLHDEKKQVNYSGLINCLNISGVDNLLSEIASMQENIGDKKRNLDDCIRWMKRNSLRNNLDCLRGRIKEAQESGEHDKVTDLVVKYNQLMRESARH